MLLPTSIVSSRRVEVIPHVYAIVERLPQGVKERRLNRLHGRFPTPLNSIETEGTLGVTKWHALSIAIHTFR